VASVLMRKDFCCGSQGCRVFTERSCWCSDHVFQYY